MNYLSPTYFFDYKHKGVQKLLIGFIDSSLSPTEKTIGLYLKIRDGIRYDPYSISLKKESLKASSIALKPKGHCVDKSILLIACLRAVGVPARIHLAKVKNHIAIERLTEKFGTNELTPHGMVAAFLNGKWLKLSPTFNASICKMLQVPPLEFDGKKDSIFQQFTSDGKKFMEYLEDYGHFEDVPYDFIRNNIMEHYPKYFNSNTTEYKF
ncbi:MAG: transglutaminase family protein [Cellulophaga sp.]